MSFARQQAYKAYIAPVMEFSFTVMSSLYNTDQKE